MIARAYRWVIVPGVVGAHVMGILLLSSMWRAMLRMRWFVTKAVLIVAGMPALHVWLSTRVKALEQVSRTSGDLTSAARLDRQIMVGAIIAFLLGVVIAFLGRVKPRLGQDFSRTQRGDG